MYFEIFPLEIRETNNAIEHNLRVERPLGHGGRPPMYSFPAPQAATCYQQGELFR